MTERSPAGGASEQVTPWASLPASSVPGSTGQRGLGGGALRVRTYRASTPRARGWATSLWGCPVVCSRASFQAGLRSLAASSWES